MDEISFRFMTVNDIEDVMNVELNSFTVPWNSETFHNELTQNLFAKYHLIEVNGKIAGYCGVWLIVDEAHMTNIAILPEYRGKQLGDALLKKVIDFCKAEGANILTLEVRVSNIVAQNLYKKHGFMPGGIRKNYYSDNQEDAIVMWVNLND